MKRNTCLTLFFFTFLLNVNISIAQVQRCGTYELHKMRMETDSVYRAYYENIGQRMKAWQKDFVSKTTDQSNAKVSEPATGSIITIPVVVHVVYNTDEQNISDAQVQSQINVLNQDYTAGNSNIYDEPAGFKSRIGNAHLNFCLATVTPDGEYTTGIERKYTTITSFVYGIDARVKYSSEGGLDAWDRSRYLNLWVCNMSDGLLGYTEMLPCPPELDGCVILYSAFGSYGSAVAPYNLGRTATHEIGHWLGLFHTWGDDGGACSGTDHIDDTPNQANCTFGCPSFPDIDSCARYKDDDSIPGDTVNGIMFMNYMDYTDDRCMCMFTVDQVAVMYGILDTSRSSILTSTGCTNAVGLAGLKAETFIDVYPNPAYNIIHIDSHLPSATILSVAAYDMLGKNLLTSDIHQAGEQRINLDVSALNAGLYTLVVNTDQGNIAKRFAVVR